MKKIMIIVDMQKDFIDGSLGTAEAQAIVENAVNEIKSFDGELICTYDTHFDNYLDTAEGKKLPVAHCIKGTPGWELDARIQNALEGRKCTFVEKNTFGSTRLPEIVSDLCDGDEPVIEVIGLCTDICVVSNVLILKAAFPERSITVNASCCAGVTPELHNAALKTMSSCQIDII